MIARERTGEQMNEISVTQRRGVLLAGLTLPVLALTPTMSRAGSPLLGGLMAVDRFLATWRGEGPEQPRVSKVERTYEPALAGRFMVARSTSRYKRQPMNPKGETHQDMGWYNRGHAVHQG